MLNKELVSVGVKYAVKGIKMVRPYIVPVVMSVVSVTSELKSARHIDGLEKRIVDLEKLNKYGNN